MGGNLARLMNVEDAVLVSCVDGLGAIPALTVAAGDALRRRSRPSSTATSRSPTPSSSSRPRTFGAALVASGIEPGDRVAIWAPNSARVDRRRARPVPGRRGAGADQHPLQGRRGGRHPLAAAARACSSPSPTSSAPTTSPCSTRAGVDAARPRTRSSSSPGPAGAGTGRGTRSVAGALPKALGRGRPARGGGRHRRRSVRHPLHVRARPACPRASCRPTAARCSVATDWVAMTGLAAGDRYLMVNPYFHMFGLKAGILAVGRRRRDDAPRAGVRRRPCAGACRGRAGDGAAGRADALPVDPRPPATATARPVEPCGSRSPARPTSRSSSSAAIDRRAAVLDDHHRLRAHRGRHRGGHGAGRRRRDDRHDGRAARGRASSCASSTATASDVPPGEAGEILLRGGSIMSHYLDDPGGDRGGALGRRLAAAPATSACVDDAGLPAHRRSVQGHVHRRRLQRLSRRDRERARCATPTSSRPR